MVLGLWILKLINWRPDYRRYTPCPSLLDELTCSAGQRDGEDEAGLLRDGEAEEAGRLELLPVHDVAVVLVRHQLDGRHYVCNSACSLPSTNRFIHDS